MISRGLLEVVQSAAVEVTTLVNKEGTHRHGKVLGAFRRGVGAPVWVFVAARECRNGGFMIIY